MSGWYAWGPLLLSVGSMLTVVGLLGRNSKTARIFCAGASIALLCRYIWWRFEFSIPKEQDRLQTAWAWCFFILETLSICSSITVAIFMARNVNRTAEADARQSSRLLTAPTDVFIATYNENYAILERTIIGALNIDHPDLRVWVLDDGARDWVRDLAGELGAWYVRRVNGAHAKAGNINNGLAWALSVGRRPDFILLLDADFVANRIILRRTLGLFEESDVGIVQTPQHFWNADPIQSNLLCANVWPDEQRFFFNTLLESKDAWGAAFCCGTSAVFRVAAFEAAGGMAVETVTEDMLTTFKFGEFGYRTIFLNEKLSLGLAPEGLREYVSQRSRWCLGAVQQIYTRWGFAGRARMSLVNRLSSLDGASYWLFTFIFKFAVIMAPLIYWWTGTMVIDSTLEGILYWLAPASIGGIVFMTLYAKNTVMPIMTDVTQLVAATTIIRSVAVGLVRPWGHAFKVTAKGASADRVTVQWAIMLPFVCIAVATLAGVIINASVYSPLNGTQGYAMNVFWSIFNIIVLSLAAAVCVELPRRRKDERFISGEPAIFYLGETAVPCTVRDISTGGARLVRPEGWDSPKDGMLVLDDGAIEARCVTVRMSGQELSVRFDDEPLLRRRLIAKLFTGRYHNDVESVRIGMVVIRLVKRLIA
jgi:cellulose synthase (UDP-forming)